MGSVKIPTYVHICDVCKAKYDAVMSIRDYCEHPPQLTHCNQLMRRYFGPGDAPMPLMTNENLYTNLRADDGTDISTRAKHRQYMRDKNLTTVDDFKSTWKQMRREAVERHEAVDATRARDIDAAIERLGGETNG
jgi:hypothetical protein